jgi:activating signal cointegrator 1
VNSTMKALTIHQPFAHLIVTPQAELPAGAVQKRVENRRANVLYRGPLLIHAGKSLNWFDADDWPPTPAKSELSFDDFPDMAFGAIVGVVELMACRTIQDIRARRLPAWLAWVETHKHTEGPFCWILGNVQRFKTPVPFRGQQGLFDVPFDVVKGELEGRCSVTTARVANHPVPGR